MSSTDFELSPSLRERLATGVDYDVLVKDSLNYEDAAANNRNGIGWGAPAGGAYSTVGDLAKLVSLELGFGPRADAGRLVVLAIRKLRSTIPARR